MSGRRGKQTKWVQRREADATAEDDIQVVLKVGSKRSAHPITVKLDVNDKTLSMELDTGAGVSIISERTQRSLFPDGIQDPMQLWKGVHWRDQEGPGNPP